LVSAVDFFALTDDYYYIGAYWIKISGDFQMIKSFAIIINNEIIFVDKKEQKETSWLISQPSNRNHLNDKLKFEVVIFANSLTKVLSNHQWRLHKIILQPEKSFVKERILIHQVFNKKLDLDISYCVLGEFTDGSRVGFEILKKFQERIEKIYDMKTLASTIKNKRKIFEQLCEEIVYYLIRTYKERKDRLKSKNMHEKFSGKPSLLYSGVSTMGLPVCSKLHDIALVNGNGPEYFETTLSGRLATIWINSYLRAKSHVEEIQILLDDTKQQKQKYGFINFARIGIERLYTLEMFSLNKSREFFNKTRDYCDENFPCLTSEFVGELSPYTQLQAYLSKLKNK
jgi:hypothetical protein